MKAQVKTAIVTGASRGIGRAIARRLARMNFRLMLTARREENLKVLEREVREMGCEVASTAVDLVEPTAAEYILSETQRRFGALDVLVNNAGYFYEARVEETSVEELHKVMSVNFMAPYLLIKSAIPMLRKSPEASVINLCSVASSVGHQGQGAYAASKHALHGMSKSLSKELGADNIRVHAIHPGGVDTDMALHAGAHIAPEQLIGSEEIADIVAFLLSFGRNGMIDDIHVRRMKGRAS